MWGLGWALGTNPISYTLRARSAMPLAICQEILSGVQRLIFFLESGVPREKRTPEWWPNSAPGTTLQRLVSNPGLQRGMGAVPAIFIFLAFDVGGLVFQFCVFVTGWRHALRSEWPFVIIIITG